MHLQKMHAIDEEITIAPGETFETDAFFIQQISWSVMSGLLLYGTSDIQNRLTSLKMTEEKLEFDSKVDQLVQDRVVFVVNLLEKLSGDAKLKKSQTTYDQFMGMLLTPQLTKSEFIEFEKWVHPRVVKLIETHAAALNAHDNARKIRLTLFFNLYERNDTSRDYEHKIGEFLDKAMAEQNVSQALTYQIQHFLAFVGESEILDDELTKMISDLSDDLAVSKAKTKKVVAIVSEIFDHMRRRGYVANWGQFLEVPYNLFLIHEYLREMRDLNDWMWDAMKQAIAAITRAANPENWYMRKIGDESSPFVTIPKGTILYRAFSGERRSKAWEFATILWFAFDIYSAYFYGVDMDTNKTLKQVCDNLGWIRVVRVKQDIRLPNMKNLATLASIRKKIKATGDADLEKDYADSFFMADEKLQRHSVHDKDKRWAKWLCNNGYDGYIANTIGGFMAEIAICDFRNHLETVDIYSLRDFGGRFCDPIYQTYPTPLRNTQTLDVGRNKYDRMTEIRYKAETDILKEIARIEIAGGERRLEITDEFNVGSHLYRFKDYKVTVTVDKLDKRHLTFTWNADVDLKGIAKL